MPVRLEVCGLLEALSDTLNVPVLVPTAVGENVTLIVQLVLAGRVAAQVYAETAKSPVTEMEILCSDTLWWLVRVKFFATLVVPTVVAL